MFSRLQPRTRILTQLENGWVCKSCRSNSRLRANFSSSTRSLEKPYYITTPIFYVNAAPHVGHLYTMVLTDILKRWQVLKGKKAILCTGTDEHGMKIQRAAALAQLPPKEFCDNISENFRTLAKKAGIANDHFIRTTDQDHKDAAQYFWTVLQEKGFIYEKKHEGWYCVSDETFYPESAIEKRLDPFTGRTFMASQETKNEVEWTSERNYHFRLSAMKDRLLEFYKENPEFVVPVGRMKDVVNQVSAGLQDLSISRPVERLSWGVQVPGDEGQTMYVWLDALVNYITKAGYPWAPGQQNAKGWPADVQVIGKDIVRFHCIYWPAFLLAADLQPPKQVLTHAHWTMDKLKMSKSIGNVVNPFFAIERFGLDTMRYYLAHDGGIQDDSDYGNDIIVDKYKKGLQSGLGGLLNRITRPKIWKVREAVEAARDGKLASSPDTDGQIEMLEELPLAVDAKMKTLNPGAGLHVIMDTIYETNRYLTILEPWHVLKSKEYLEGDQLAKDEIKSHVNAAIYYTADTLRIAGILLQPYMPGKAAELLDKLGVGKEKRKFEDAKLGADLEYGKDIGFAKKVWDGLFPPLPVKD